MEKIVYQGQTLTRWVVGNSTFLALPEQGARLMSWNIGLGDGSVRDVLYWPENADWSNVAKIRGGNPILFPFCGRCFDSGAIHQWRAADGTRRPMPMHGFARQSEFKISHVNPRGFVAQMIPSEEAQAGYPFKYEFVVTYRFEALAFTCELALSNLGREPLPWSPGHHFYFAVPWSEGARRADYLIRILASRRLKQDFNTGMLTPGPALPVQESLASAALSDTFHLGVQGNEVVFGERGRAGDIAVKIGSGGTTVSDAAFVTWTAADDSPFYCVEPWMGPANAPENKIGLQYVAPGTTQKFTVHVSLR